MDVSLTAVITVQALAAAIGGMAFFLPNGLGAHDGITVALVATVIGVPIPLAATAALLVRVSDLLAKALVLLLLPLLSWLPLRLGRILDRRGSIQGREEPRRQRRLDRLGQQSRAA
jgi:hypothetical protein